MATAKVNSPKITEYFPPSPVRDEVQEKTTRNDEVEKAESVSERLSTSSVFITPNPSPEKDEQKPETDIDVKTEDIKPQPECRKALSEKLNSEVKTEQKDSARPKSRRRRRKKKQDSVKTEEQQETPTNGPAKPKTPRKKKTEGDGLKNTLLTDYFPVRRSDRRPKSELEREKEDDLVNKILSGCEDGLRIVDFENKGRGVVATKMFDRGDFVVEYAGDLISIPEAKKREEKYAKDETKGCYMYYFNFKNRKYCIDATSESGKLGRLLNHSKTQGNCHTKQVDVKGRPYLILVASRKISEGEELLYDYGDRSREALESHPWLKS